MILMHRNMIFLSLALGVMPALQGAMLTRVTSKLPAVATLKKAVTWKRAGLGACVLAFLAYKKIVKNDAQIINEFGRGFAEEARKIAKTARKQVVHTEKTSRKALHWFGRPKRWVYAKTFEVEYTEGDVHYKGAMYYNVEPGYFFDTHDLEARVAITKHKPQKALLQDKQGAST